jgi:hypothetical protein
LEATPHAAGFWRRFLRIDAADWNKGVATVAASLATSAFRAKIVLLAFWKKSLNCRKLLRVVLDRIRPKRPEQRLQ